MARRYAQRIANRVTRCQRHDTPAACVLDTANACQLGAHVFGIDVGSCTTLEWHAAVYDELGPGSYGSAYYCQGSMAAEAARCKRVLQALRYRCAPCMYGSCLQGFTPGLLHAACSKRPECSPRQTHGALDNIHTHDMTYMGLFLAGP